MLFYNGAKYSTEFPVIKSTKEFFAGQFVKYVYFFLPEFVW